ncbi:MAG: VWA domain-containing protein [Verrucomicrobiota bacterium]
MNFINSNPLFVSLSAAFVLLAAGLLWFGDRRRRRMVEGLTGPVMAERLTLSLDRSRRRLRQVLLVASLIFMAVAGARPWWGYRLVEAPSRSRDVLIAVDCSRSMLAEDVSPSRLEHAKWWIREVVRASPGDRFGLITFAGSAFLECPLTQDRNTLFQFLADLDTTTIPVGGTNVEEALANAREAFEGAEGPNRAVVLISDGGEQQGRAATELEKLRKADIPVFVVGVGDPTQMTPIRTEEGKYVRDQDGEIVETTLHESMLRELSTATGGVYVRSTSVKPNTGPVVRRIRKLLPEQREGSRTRRPRERYQFPLALAVLLLLLRMSVGERTSAARLATVCLLFVAVLPSRADPRAPNIAELADSPSAASESADAETAERVDALEQQLAQAKGRESARLAFNLGVLKHRLGEFDEAETRYRQTMDRAGDDGEIVALAAQNLGALKQQRADAVMMEDPDQALKMLERAKSYTLEALRRNPDNEGAARNQERLGNQQKLARELKKLREQLEKQKEDALKKTEQAQQEQKNANQSKDPSEKEKKQQQAQKRTEEANQATQKLEETASQAEDQKTRQNAQAAKEALQKARLAQRQKQGEEAEKHLEDARKQLARNDKNGDESQQKTPEQEDSPNSKNDSTSEGDDRNKAENGDDKPSPEDQDKPTDDDADSDSDEKGKGQPAAAEKIGKEVARSLLLQMLEEEKELREAIKEYRSRKRKLEPVEKDW